MPDGCSPTATSPYDWATLEARFRDSVEIPGLDPAAPDWWDRWHRHVASRSTPRWFYAPETSPRWFGRHWPELTRTWIQVGESQLRDLVHAGDFRPGRLPDGDIDWGANPSRSTNWAGFHYWSWANPLIRAYALTGDERFPREIARHLHSYFAQVDTFTPQLWEGADPAARDWRDWVVHNDLSAGIKLATLSEAVAVFRASPSWTVEDLRRATLLLLRLGERLYTTYAAAEHASDFLRTYNFLTSGASGLGVVAGLFPESGFSTPWMKLSLGILETHLEQLYYADGGHRELCTQYHKASIRDILFLEQFLAANGHGYFLAREPHRSHVRRIIRWLLAILMPDGSTAVLNSAAAANDWLVFALVANRQLQDPEFNWHIRRWFTTDYVPRQKGIPALCARILGDGDAPPPSASVRAPEYTSVLLPESGIAVLRDGWHRWADTMVIDFGRPVGGHAFPARGSFSLYLRGRPVALSPGSPHAYSDPEYSAWMHTSRSQNNVLIDDLDQEQWELPRVRRVHGEITLWHGLADPVVVQGRHDGYADSLGIVHWRTVCMLAGRFFLIHDWLDARGATAPHTAKWSLQCPLPLDESADRVLRWTDHLTVAPAWPQRITAIERSHTGKAVWPGPAPDGTMSQLTRLYQTRWCTPVPKGGSAEFLMLIHGGRDQGAVRVEEARDGELVARIRLGEYSDTVSLPVPAGYAPIHPDKDCAP